MVCKQEKKVMSMEMDRISIITMENEKIQLKSNFLLKSKARVVYHYTKKGGRCDCDQQIFEEFQTSKRNKVGAINFPRGIRGNAKKNTKKKIGKHKSQNITKMKSD